MSTENSISTEIRPEEIEKVKAALSEIQSTLAPFIVALSAEQRKSLPKMSDGTEPFVEKVLDYAEDSPEFVPPYLNTDELKKDFALTQQLMPVLRTVEQLASNLSDTTMLAGSEAYVTALSYYNSVKMASKMNIPGAKTIHEDLKRRFAKRSNGAAVASE
ncbi:hypothetical protein [Marinoscillum furvescens]|uniref:Uncharacterized protein n=1 Tax=Marinoscillum furvescens DSM 4134 TaxID=1122208 RepID=A0A3D9KWF6_MARFU|nr:hypothetical protein [Marinoscillum furvescens]RED92434.1 hypothetical protein C7460_1302 [Marinoscillum furvescens DSM 4134]